jgi:NitT/TauT family transport system permease protein
MAPTHPPSTRVGRWAAHLVLLSVILGTWEVVAGRAQALLLPTASETGLALWRMAGTSELWSAIWISNQALMIGFPLSAGAGVLVGLALGHWPGLNRWLGVHLNILLVTPKSALMPLILMAFGFGLGTRAAIVAAFAFPIIAVTTRAAAESVDPRLIQMARAFGATRAAVWRHVLLPGALPGIITALRLGLARGVAGMVAVELLLVAVGVGRLILRYQADFDAGAIYATVLVVAAEAVILMRAARAVTKGREAWGNEVAVG